MSGRGLLPVPAALGYESPGIFAPGACMTAAGNGDYACSRHTASTASVVIPVNNPGYPAMTAPMDYAPVAAAYTDAVFVYVSTYCRGPANGTDGSGNPICAGGAP